jgi:DNA-binding response OmpR family regulator
MKYNKVYKLLLVEDDSSLGYLLSEYLKMKSFDITWVKNGNEALIHILEHHYDLVVLDIMMPDMDGYALASKIKQQFPNIPFIFLTARSMKIDVLKGFAIGAVDYIKKPIDEEELVVRINAILSRITPTQGYDYSTRYVMGKYILDTNSQVLTYGNEIIKLTSRENDLLHLLIKNKNKLCSHKEILVAIWGKNDYFNRKSLNVFVSHLRSYLREDKSLRIENIHGKGFILFIPDHQ